MKSSKNQPQPRAELDAARQTTTDREGELQRILKEAAATAHAPMASVSIIDRNRQRFAAKLGLDAQEALRLNAISSRVILRPGEPLIIFDARQDARYATIPAVTDAPFIRFYVGIPLVDRAGYALGALCVADTVPREEFPNVATFKRLARKAERFITSY